MHSTERTFLPAAGFDLALPLYDPLTRLMGADAVRAKLLEAAELRPGQCVLDIGCGTGTLLIAAARRAPGVELVGIDPDPAALQRARRKAARAGVAVRFEQAFADVLPFADATFDCVLSSFMFHHLEQPTQQGALREVARVLKPGARLQLIDFTHAHQGGHGALQHLMHRLHGGGRFAHVHFASDLPGLLERAGLRDVHESEQRRVLFQRVVHYTASRPAAA